MSDFSLPTDSVGEILASGFLVQWEGINPGTGEAWKPVWVSREECPAEVVARWEARMKYKGVTQEAKKRLRSASPSIESKLEMPVKEENDRSQKKLKHFGKPPVDRKNSTSGTPGFRPFYKKPKPATAARKTTMLNEPVQAIMKDTGSPTESTGNTSHWLLDSVISTKNGMTVVLTGTHGSFGGGGWYNGDYESERGIVLSIFNTGNSAFPSTAQVKMLKAREGAPSSFQIPVEFLAPVRPECPGQKAVVLDGECKGEVAVIREEGAYEGEWFVSVRNNHFEVSGEKLVLYHELED